MRKLLLSALLLPALFLSCSTEEENAVANTENREITPKAICIPATGDGGINAEVLGVSRRLFVTWNNNLTQNLSLYYESELQIRNSNCANGSVSDIIDTYPIDIFNTNVYGIHQLSGTCFNWRIVVKGYKLYSSGPVLNCTTQTQWAGYTP